jgi:hypothetical protein
MLRCLREKGLLDLAYDGIQLVVPGRLGRVLAAAITLSVALVLMYVVNYPTVARWFQDTYP